MSRFFCAAAIALLALSAGRSSGQETSPRSVQDALRSGDEKTAIHAVESLLEENPDSPRVIMLAADTYLRCNKAELAVPLYDRYIKAIPRSMPQLWQRGIALYFIGQYAEASEQFVEHRRVNPHDVENAAWHFLCLAKAKSFEKAAESVLPAPNDPRVPMAEIQQMLLTGDPTLVTKRMKKVAKNSPEYGSAMFYGNFYLGLYADAQGDHATAFDKMTQAAKDAPHHYMGDVSRVYAAYLGKSK